MEAQWFYGMATNRLGPVSASELQRLATVGQVAPATFVWTAGMPSWVAAGTLPFLYPAGTYVGAPLTSDAGLNLLLPMGPQSGWAITAGYCGLFSLLFAIPAPFAIIFGIMGLREIKAHPEKRGKGRAITGIVLGSLVTLGFMAVMVAALTAKSHSSY